MPSRADLRPTLRPCRLHSECPSTLEECRATRQNLLSLLRVSAATARGWAHAAQLKKGIAGLNSIAEKLRDRNCGLGSHDHCSESRDVKFLLLTCR